MTGEAVSWRENVERAVAEMRRGGPVIVTHDEDRENEGGLIIVARRRRGQRGVPDPQRLRHHHLDTYDRIAPGQVWLNLDEVSLLPLSERPMFQARTGLRAERQVWRAEGSPAFPTAKQAIVPCRRSATVRPDSALREQTRIPIAQEYEVMVGGVGPAGCALAVRLSEDPDRSVLLIGADPDFLAQADMPEVLRARPGCMVQDPAFLWSCDVELVDGRTESVARTSAGRARSTVKRMRFHAWTPGGPFWLIESELDGKGMRHGLG
jgi:hypothetical protein